MRHLLRYFFQGLIVLVPLAVTGYVLWSSFWAIDGWLDLPVPGLGLLVVLATVLAIGFLTSLFLIRPLMRAFDALLGRLPVINLIYGSVRDLLSAVVGEEKRFNRPVLVRISDGVEVIGFVTRDSLDEQPKELHLVEGERVLRIADLQRVRGEAHLRVADVDQLGGGART